MLRYYARTDPTLTCDATRVKISEEKLFKYSWCAAGINWRYMFRFVFFQVMELYPTRIAVMKHSVLSPFFPDRDGGGSQCRGRLLGSLPALWWRRLVASSPHQVTLAHRSSSWWIRKAWLISPSWIRRSRSPMAWTGHDACGWMHLLNTFPSLHNQVEISSHAKYYFQFAK